MIHHAAPLSIGVIAFTVFVLGLRHGADPDHLAAIDNLTRNSLSAKERLSRFVGTLFAGGHSVMVLSIAALAGLFGSRLALHGALLEIIGTWVSIVTLLAIAGLNIRQLILHRAGPIAGLKNQLLPKSLRTATSPLAAIPIGLLFGLGFDTSSQVATYALALTAGGGILLGLLIGALFSFGMAVTDTLDSLLVYRLCTRQPLELVRATRVWIIAVTALALFVAFYEMAQALGWKSPVPDLAVSGVLVGALLIVFAWTFTWSARDPEGAGSTGGFKMNRKAIGIVAAVAVLAALGTAFSLYGARPGLSSDHADSPAMLARPGADITDVYVFPAADTNNVVLAMDVHPLIPAGQGPSTFFDPGVMYQLRIDNTGDHVEDLVIQFSASEPKDGSQTITLHGPGKPNQAGTENTWIGSSGTFKYNTVSKLKGGVTVFAGPREDPFFFDLARFFEIIPDRNFGNHLNGKTVPAATANGFRGFAAGSSCDTTPSQDFLSANKFNVLSLVIELPRTALATAGGSPGKINVWASTSISNSASPYGGTYTQIERLGRPAVKEAFESFDRHDKTNRSAPTSDPYLPDDIVSFTKTVAGRSDAIANTLKAVLIPDEILADLSKTGVKAAYLGTETGGATGSTFGGRGLNDDVIDISLGAIFGGTLPALKLTPDDGKESKCLTTDNVGPDGHHYLGSFPYVGSPN
jgi:high-affinity nickel-transport protein